MAHRLVVLSICKWQLTGRKEILPAIVYCLRSKCSRRDRTLERRNDLHVHPGGKFLLRWHNLCFIVLSMHVSEEVLNDTHQLQKLSIIQHQHS
jgi:hypothetical protein